MTTSGMPPTVKATLGTADAHQFQDAQAKTFGFRGKQPKIGGLEIVFDVADFFPHNHAIGEAKALHLRDEGCEAFACKDHEFETFAWLDACDGFKQQINALELTEIGKMQNHRDALGNSQFATHFVA